MMDASEQECTCDAKTVTWSEEHQMYVCSGCKLPMPEWWYDEWKAEQARERKDCRYCGGDGMEDDSNPCPYCNGEGYEWWR